jgi:imidazolonepropionase-like amidohydrolase
MLVIRVGRLIDGRGTEPLRGGVVALDGERITYVGSGEEYVAPPGAEVWDFPRFTMLPGLIDAHVHVLGSGEPDDAAWFVRGATELPGALAFHCLLNAQRNLRAGFTTVRDLSCQQFADVALRDAIAAGRLEGPRLRVCGLGLTSTAGHMDRSKHFAPGVTLAEPAATVDGPDEARRAVRMNLQFDVDFIKINATLSELVRRRGGLYSPEMTLETMRAICEEAHAHGRRVTAHCHGGVGVDWALEAGVDGLEHGRFLSDEQLATMAEGRIFLCPTLSPDARAHELGLPATDCHLSAWREKARGVMYDTVRRARQAGVPIVNGSDAAMPGVTHGHGGAYEIAQLVKAGLTSMEAIVAATSAAARCLDMAAQVGTIEVGKLADLVFVDGDPLANIGILQDLSRIPLVLKGGRVAADRRPEGGPPDAAGGTPRGGATRAPQGEVRTRE